MAIRIRDHPFDRADRLARSQHLSHASELLGIVENVFALGAPAAHAAAHDRSGSRLRHPGSRDGLHSRFGIARHRNIFQT